MTYRLAKKIMQCKSELCENKYHRNKAWKKLRRRPGWHRFFHPDMIDVYGYEK